MGQAEVRDRSICVLRSPPTCSSGRDPRPAHARPRPGLGRRRRLPAMELPLRDVRGRARRCPGAASHAVVARDPRRRRPVVSRQRLARPASAARDARRATHVDGVRASPIAGVLLTDAEIDHTAGLLLLRESTTPVRVFGAAGVERALQGHAPCACCSASAASTGRRSNRGAPRRSRPGRAWWRRPPRSDVDGEASGFVFDPRRRRRHLRARARQAG